MPNKPKSLLNKPANQATGQIVKPGSAGLPLINDGLPESGNFTLRFGRTPKGRRLMRQFYKQTQKAGFEKPTPYMKKVIERIQEITGGKPFDVRRLEYRHDGDLAASDSATHNKTAQNKESNNSDHS